MARFDSENRVLVGKRVPQIYHKFTSVGQVLMNVLNDYKGRVLQINYDDGTELTSKQLLHMMINIAKNLYNFGFRAGDVAGLCASSTTYLAPLVFGCLLLRLPITPVDLRFDVDIIVAFFLKTNPKIIFCDHDVVDKINAVKEVIGSNAIVVTMTDRIAGFNHVTDLIADCHVNNDSIPSTQVPALIIFTMNSIENPKLALISHLQLLQLYIWYDDRVQYKLSYCPVQPFFSAAFVSMIYRILSGRTRLITAKPFSADLFFDIIEKYKIEEVCLFSSLVKLIIESPRYEEADLSCIKQINSGGMVPLPPRFREMLLQKLTNGILVIVFGAFETGAIATKIVTHECSSSIGQPMVNTKIKIQLDDGTPAFPNEIGEVLVKQPVNYLGYLDNEFPNKIDADGWFHTGDMGFIDNSHELNIVGQRNEAIKNIHCEIYPFEIESRILSINGVKNVVVVGTPDPTEVYVLTALVVKALGSNVDEESIHIVIRDLPDHEKLKGGVFFVNQLPLSVNGAIERNAAKDMATRLKFEKLNSELEI